MKRKILSFILALCFVMPCMFIFNACGDSATVYTVTEAEWEINFNITKTPTQQTRAKTKATILLNTIFHPQNKKANYEPYE